jgi:hypothetical protein
MKKVTVEAKLSLEEEGDDMVLYVIFNGKRIAKRQCGQNWINLEPGYTVTGSEPGTDYNSVVIDFDPELAKAQS